LTSWLIATPSERQLPDGFKWDSLAWTKALKAIAHCVVRKKAREGTACDLREQTPDLFAELIPEVNAKASKKEVDSKVDLH
jgi:hypothetical protein